MAVKQDFTIHDYGRAVQEAEKGLLKLPVVFGDCEFLRAEAVGRLRAAWRGRYPGGDETVIRGAGENRPVSLSDVTRELSGGSLFAREKLVVVRQGEKLLFPGKAEGDADAGGGAGTDREKAFIRRIEELPEQIWLIVETAQLPKNRTLGKRLAAAGHVIPCPQPSQRDVPAWLAVRGRELGKAVDDEAVDLLVRTYGADLGTLAREVDKLALFAGDGKTIDAAMAREFLVDTIEFEIFGFTNAIEARDTAKALFFARRIALQGTRDQRGKREDGERSAHKVLSMTAGTVQGLLRARVALAERMDSRRFAAAEKISPWRAGKLLEAAGKFDLRRLRMMTGFTADQLRRVHDTGGDPLLALEMLAVRLTAGS